MAKLIQHVGTAMTFALLLTVPETANAQPNRPNPDTNAAWAAAFADLSVRLCNIYQVDPEAERDSGGLYWPDAAEWQDHGPAMLAFREGGHAAEAAARNNPLFCVDPAAAAGSRAELVKRFLIPRREPAR